MKGLNYFLLSILVLFVAACSSNKSKKQIEVEGTVEGIDVIVSAKTAGTLLELRKDEGSFVKAGDTLAALDHETATIKLEQAEANLQIARAALLLLENGSRKEDVELAIEKFNQANASFQLASKEANRVKNLFRKNSVTKEKLDKAIAQLKIAKAQLNAAKATLKKIKNISRPEQITQAKARVKAAEAAVKLLQKNINDSYLIAPVDGIIVKKFFEKGEFVPVLGNVFEIENLKNPDVIVYIPETKLGLVKRGQRAIILTDSFPNKKFNGKVVTISSEAEFTPKTIQTKEERVKLVYEIKIKAQNPDYELKSGMPVDVKIILN